MFSCIFAYKVQFHDSFSVGKAKTEYLLSILFYRVLRFLNMDGVFESKEVPGDFVTNMKQINGQSDLTSMSSFSSSSYLTVRSSLYIILI